MGDDRTGRIDRARGSKTLDARGDVDGLAEIILAVVQYDRQARPLMEADLQQQILAAALGVEGTHRLADAQGRGDRSVWGREGRHHRVADRLDHGPGFGGDDLVEDAEMRPHHVEGDEVADPLVQLGRAFEVGEQKSQAGNVEPLIDVDRVGAVDVAEGLVGQEALRGQERPPPPEQLV